MDVVEFTLAVRSECDLQVEELDDDAIAELFRFADTTVRSQLFRSLNNQASRQTDGRLATYGVMQKLTI